MPEKLLSCFLCFFFYTLYSDIRYQLFKLAKSMGVTLMSLKSLEKLERPKTIKIIHHKWGEGGNFISSSTGVFNVM